MCDCIVQLLILLIITGCQSTIPQSWLDDYPLEDEPLDESRIIGGRYARKGEFPFAVAISRFYNASTCGGVILNYLYILTACHCTVEVDVGDEKKASNMTPKYHGNMRIVAGSLTRNPLETNEQGFQVRWVYVWKLHPKCEALRTGEWLYDLAVITVTQPFTFNKFVQPIKLPCNQLAFSGMVRLWQTIQKSCHVVGWGFTKVLYADNRFEEIYEEPSIYIKALATRLLPPSLCLFALCETVCGVDRLCAQAKYRASGTVCGGDSGGPLVCGEYVVGIVSYSGGCGQLDEPVIYAKVDTAFDFIAEYYIKPLKYFAGYNTSDLPVQMLHK